MKITDIRSMYLEGPRNHMVGGGTGTARKLVIRVDTDEGTYGLGEASYWTASPMGVRDAVEYIRMMLIGKDPLAIRPALSEMMYGTLPPHPVERRDPPPQLRDGMFPILSCSPTVIQPGPVTWAISGIEMALCDLAGKILGTPVYNLLGGKFRDRVRIYLDRSSPDDVDNLDSWKRMGTQVVEDGFSHMKFDIDYAAPDHTDDVWNRSISAPQMNRIVERISAVRETVGWDMQIAVDCHMQYNVVDAIRLANELAPLKPFWLEDPTPLYNPGAVAQIREKSPVPICIGEQFTAEEIRQFIDAGACDIIHPDILYDGGVFESRRIADYAELHYIPMAMHGGGGALATIAAAHVAAATRNFLALEYHHIETPWIGTFVRRNGAPLFENGHLVLTDAPGYGVELDEEVCAANLGPGESLF
jgi:galactonate dehydratase